MKNRTANALLKENRKALQFMHVAYGFDFEKPFFIKRLEGRFTYNTVTKAISEKLDGNYKAVILVKPLNYYRKEQLHFVKIGAEKFKPLDKPEKWYNFNVDYFYSIGDFEETRKSNTEFIYIIAQNTEYIKLPAEKRIDANTRYNIADEDFRHGITKTIDGARHCWISEIILKPRDGSRTRLKYDPFRSFYFEERVKSGDDINNYIDKSGYLIRAKRHDLLTRAKALKAEREKAALLKADFTAEETRIFAKLEEAKKQLADGVLFARTIEDGAKVSRAAARLYYAVSSADRYKKREFSSIGEKQKALDFLSNDISLIITTLEGE